MSEEAAGYQPTWTAGTQVKVSANTGNITAGACSISGTVVSIKFNILSIVLALGSASFTASDIVLGAAYTKACAADTKAAGQLTMVESLINLLAGAKSGTDATVTQIKSYDSLIAALKTYTP